MRKIIVETPDSTQLMGSLFSNEDRVPFDRPAVVIETTYIAIKLADRALTKLADVPDHADDASWAEHLAEVGSDDMELAIESYVSALPPPPEAEVVTDDDKKKKSKAGDDRAKGGAPKSGQPNSDQPALDPALK